MKNDLVAIINLNVSYFFVFSIYITGVELTAINPIHFHEMLFISHLSYHIDTTFCRISCVLCNFSELGSFHHK